MMGTPKLTFLPFDAVATLSEICCKFDTKCLARAGSIFISTFCSDILTFG